MSFYLILLLFWHGEWPIRLSIKVLATNYNNYESYYSKFNNRSKKLTNSTKQINPLIRDITPKFYFNNNMYKEAATKSIKVFSESNLTKQYNKIKLFEKIGFIEELSSSEKGWGHNGLKAEEPPDLKFLNYWNSHNKKNFTILKNIHSKINEMSKNIINFKTTKNNIKIFRSIRSFGFIRSK